MWQDTCCRKRHQEQPMQIQKPFLKKGRPFLKKGRGQRLNLRWDIATGGASTQGSSTTFGMNCKQRKLFHRTTSS